MREIEAAIYDNTRTQREREEYWRIHTSIPALSLSLSPSLRHLARFYGSSLCFGCLLASHCNICKLTSRYEMDLNDIYGLNMKTGNIMLMAFADNQTFTRLFCQSTKPHHTHIHYEHIHQNRYRTNRSFHSIQSLYFHFLF